MITRPRFQALLTEHFSVEEMTRTKHPIPNVPGRDQLARMRRLCSQLLEPYRTHVGRLYVSSAFRSAAVNRAVGGESTSQHLLGEAADVVPLDRPLELAWRTLVQLVEEGLPLDQGIFYVRSPGEGWMHLSYTERRGARKELLINPAPGSREYIPVRSYSGPLVLPG